MTLQCSSYIEEVIIEKSRWRVVIASVTNINLQNRYWLNSCSNKIEIKRRYNWFGYNRLRIETRCLAKFLYYALAWNVLISYDWYLIKMPRLEYVRTGIRAPKLKLLCTRCLLWRTVAWNRCRGADRKRYYCIALLYVDIYKGSNRGKEYLSGYCDYIPPPFHYLTV